jgi:FlaA1/EpsC-like NDP-sugar epimerase
MGSSRVLTNLVDVEIDLLTPPPTNVRNGPMKFVRKLNYRHLLPDLFIMAFSLYGSLFLRVDMNGLMQHLPTLNRLLPIFIFLRVATFIATGVYDIIWRYMSLEDTFKLLKGILISSLLIVAATYFIDIGRLPRSVFFIDSMLITLGLAGIRMARRLLFDHSHDKQVRETGRRTLIIGASHNGRTLANRFTTDHYLGYRLLGFIDDDPEKVSRVIGGVKVLGNMSTLPHILRQYSIQEVIVAITKPPGDLLRSLVEITKPFKIKPRMTSGAETSTTSPLQLLRPLELQDLLSRTPKDMNLASVRDLLEGRRVLITGAGGSIGSELARQIFRCNPSRLLLMDHSEFNLFEIDRELRTSNDMELIVPLLVDIKDKTALEAAMKEFNPEVVFHAAAYKHVHLVEANPNSAILNNILGTRNLLELCEKHGVQGFVMISTDKAVNPAGVMGATKRACELLVTDVGERTGKRYCSVRFGNVLGSSGSLIPLLQKQITNGEPVTVTHPDMTRYFMLIPEAVALVLKAATMAKPGDITLLRMGEPVKIVEIARSLITLMGKTEEESPIVFTGIRPGEKMFEELYITGNEINTEHPDVLIVPGGDRSAKNQVVPIIDAIIRHAQTGSKEAVFTLNALVKSSQGHDLEQEQEDKLVSLVDSDFYKKLRTSEH